MKNFKTIGLIVVVMLIVKAVKDGLAVFGSSDKPMVLETSKVTISKSSAQTYANRLWVAMNQVGHDFEQIISVLENLKTQEDWKFVHNEFGTKQYNPLYGNDMALWNKRGLSYIINKELWESEKEFVRSNYSHLDIV